MEPKNKGNRYAIVALMTGALLLIPAIATRFTDEVDWNLFDYLIMGAILLCTGIILDNVLRKTPRNRRYLYAAIVLAVSLLVWAELAVGLFGTPFAGS